MRGGPPLALTQEVKNSITIASVDQFPPTSFKDEQTTAVAGCDELGISSFLAISSSNISLLAGEELVLVWFFFFVKTSSGDGSEGRDPHGSPGRMVASSWGSETQSREVATSVCAQFVSSAGARQTAILGALEERSLSATAAHRSTGSPICIGSVGSGIEAALKRVKEAQAATQANRAPAPEAMCEAARVRVSKLEAASEALGEFQRSSISAGSCGTCQSRRCPASSGRAVDTLSTMHRPCDEANGGSGQSSRNRIEFV